MDRTNSSPSRIATLELGTRSRQADLLKLGETRFANVPSDGSDARAEFSAAVEEYRIQYGRPFPTWSEILEIAQSLGYKKTPSVVD